MKAPLIINGKDVHIDPEFISDMGQILGVMHNTINGVFVIYMECVEGLVIFVNDEIKNCLLELNEKWWKHPNKHLTEKVATIVSQS